MALLIPNMLSLVDCKFTETIRIIKNGGRQGSVPRYFESAIVLQLQLSVLVLVLIKLTVVYCMIDLETELQFLFLSYNLVRASSTCILK